MTANEDEHIYEERIVAFLDILAFRKLIESKRGADVYEVLSSWPTEAHNVKRASRGVIELTSFSDSVVISSPIADRFNVGRVVCYSAYIYLKLLARGIMSRGGISIGKMHHKDNIAFGPALNAAYKLENELANYPRILVTEDIINIHIENEREIRNEAMANETRSLYRTDFDGLLHVDVFNPLMAIPMEMTPEFEPMGAYYPHERWPHIKKTILAVLSENKSEDMKIQVKNNWLSMYLNYSDKRMMER